MNTTIPEFAYPTERFLVSGYEEHTVYLQPTIICKHDGKAYLAHESLAEFARLITSATYNEKSVLVEALAGLKLVYSSNNPPMAMVDIDTLKPIRDANIPLVNKYLDHLDEVVKS